MESARARQSRRDPPRASDRAQEPPGDVRGAAALIRFTGFGASDLANSCFLRPGETGFRPGWETFGDELAAAGRRRGIRGPRPLHAICPLHARMAGPRHLASAGADGLSAADASSNRASARGCSSPLCPTPCAGARARPASSSIPSLPELPGCSIRDSDISNADFAKVDAAPEFRSRHRQPALFRPHRPERSRLQGHGPAAARLFHRQGDRRAQAVRPRRLRHQPGHDGQARDRGARALISASADLLAAVRLPEGAFRATAGTDVVTDVLFFQKRDASERLCAAGPGTDLTTLADRPPARSRSTAISPSIRTWCWASTASRAASTAPRSTYSCAPSRAWIYRRRCQRARRPVPGQPRARPSCTDAGGAEVATTSRAENKPTERIGTAADGALLKEGSYLHRRRRRA